MGGLIFFIKHVLLWLFWVLNWIILDPFGSEMIYLDWSVTSQCSNPVCPLPPTPHALTQLRACPSIWLTQVFEDYFSLIDVLLCFTFPEIDVIPSLHTREYVCQHFFSPWIMNNNWLNILHKFSKNNKIIPCWEYSILLGGERIMPEDRHDITFHTCQEENKFYNIKHKKLLF